MPANVENSAGATGLEKVSLHSSPKKGKKAKRLSEEALQIAEKRRDVEGKGEKERYTYLHAEFQRIEGEIRKPSSMIKA